MPYDFDSLYDELSGKGKRDTSLDSLDSFSAPTRGYDFDSLYADLTAPKAAPAAPKINHWDALKDLGSSALEGVGAIVSAPKRGIDYLARQGANIGNEYGNQVPETLTTGQMLRSAAGLDATPDSGYGERIGGRAVEFLGDMGTDPVTYALGGVSNAGKVGKAVQAGADVFFPTQMAVAAAHEGKQAYDTYQKEGFTPQAAEEAFGTALSAGMAGLAGSHALGRGREAYETLQPEVRQPAEVRVPAVRPAPEAPVPEVAPDLYAGDAPLTLENLRSPEEVRLDMMRQQGIPDISLEDVPDLSVPEPARFAQQAADESLLRRVESERQAKADQEAADQQLLEKVWQEKGLDQPVPPVVPEPLPEPLPFVKTPDEVRLDQLREAGVPDVYEPPKETEQQRIGRQGREIADAQGKVDESLFSDVPESDRPRVREATLKEAVSHLMGRDALDRFRENYGEGQDGVQRVDHGENNYDLVQRKDGKIVGGAEVRDGSLAMIFGGKGMDSPVSIRPVYEALDAAGAKRNNVLTSMGERAREAFEARKNENAGRRPEEAAGRPIGERGDQGAPEAVPTGEREATVRGAGGEARPATPEARAGQPSELAPPDLEATADYLRGLLPEIDKKGYYSAPGVERRTQRESIDYTYGNDERARHIPVSRLTGVPGLEGIGLSGPQIARLVRRGQRNPADADFQRLVREVHSNLEEESDQRAAARRQENFGEEFNPESLDAQPDMTPEQRAEADKYATRRAPEGQRGIPGIGEDVEKSEPKARGPQQRSMFGGEMLQGVERKVPEGREAEGPLFQQETKAAAKAEARRQESLFATKIADEIQANREGLVARARERFKGVPIKETENGVEIPLTRGVLRINSAGELQFDVAKVAEAHGEEIAREVAEGSRQIAGRKRTVGPDVVVDLVDNNVFSHEEGHLFLDHFATPTERATLEKAFADKANAEGRTWDETFSDAFNDYLKDKKAPTTAMGKFFQRVKDFFHRIYDTLFASKEGVFREIERGEYLKRERADIDSEPKVSAEPKFAVTPKQTGVGPQGAQFDKIGQYENWIDRWNIFRKLVERGNAPAEFEKNPELNLRTLRSRQSEGERFVDDEVARPIGKILKQSKVSYDDAAQYLYAKHALNANPVYEARSPGSHSGMSTPEAEKIIAKEKAAGRTKVLDSVGSELNKLNDKVLDFYVEKGLATKDQIAGWKKTWGDDWLALRHGVDGEPVPSPPSGGRTGLRGKEVKMRQGASEQAFDPIAATLDRAVRVFRRGEENALWNSFDKLLENSPQLKDTYEVVNKLPQEKVLDKSGEYVGFKKDGEQKYLRFKNPEHVKALASMNPSQADVIAKGVQKFTRTIAALNTRWNPVFALLSNPIVDVPEALINTGISHGKEVSAGMLKRLPEARRAASRAINGISKQELAKLSSAERKNYDQFLEYRKNGGPMGAFSMMTIPERSKTMKQLVEGENPAVASFKAVRDAIGKTGESLEAMTRFALFQELRSRGVPLAKAIMASRDVTVDFERAGLLGHDVGRYYAFFNAGIQGTNKMMRVIKDNPKAAAKVIGGLITLGVAQDQMNRAAWGDEDKDGVNDWDQVPSYVKENNLLIGGKKVPLPRGWRFFNSLGVNLSQAASGVVSPKAAGMNAALSLNGLVNPLGEGLGGKDLKKGLAVMATPTAAKPLAEIAVNQTALGGPVRPDQPKFGPKKPESELHFKNVNPLAKAIAEGLNRVTGGDKITEGAVSISPEDIEQLVSGYTGGLGKTIAQTLGTGAALAQGESPQTRQVPVASRFLYEASPTQQATQFYANKEEVEQAVAKQRAYQEEFKKSGDKKLLEKIAEQKKLSVAKNSFDVAERELKRLFEAKRAAEARKADTKMLDASIEAAYRRVNRGVAEARKKAGLPVLSASR